MNRRKGLGLFLVLAAAFSFTGCEAMHYMQPYQWGKLNRGVGGLGADGYQTMNESSPSAYFASVTDDVVKTTPVVAKKPAGQ